ncbi:voltage-gated chloride channel family protein [Ktedonospora formicarum]|uniref:voltage-gated chloride channel family protein n=1 Tax=Ktedonospora formicarum TaxID=2778364 RepID=UPI003B75BF6C
MGREKVRRLVSSYAQKWIHLALLGAFIKWVFYGSLIGLLAGTASALFLTALEWATQQQTQYSWLLLFLPLGGALTGFCYQNYGKNSSKGNNLILEQISEGQESIPFRMAPFVLFSTVLTHLFGGSAGREGTAVQMGGSFAELIGKIFRVDAFDRKLLLMCGISSGFGSVFGTPLAGTIFGMEVVAIGVVEYQALLPCFVASVVGNLVTLAWGIHHVHYAMGPVPAISAPVLLEVVLASIIFGLTSILFSELTHWLKKLYTTLFPNVVIKSFVGGVLLVLLTYGIGTRDYSGLSIPLLQRAFVEPVAPWAFFLKTVFTSLTLGAGYQGGEVTPLFVIGGTLGNALAGPLHLPLTFLASLGLVAVFCGATNTPIACFVLGIEMFGSQGSVYLFLACVISYLFSAHTGIYQSQRIGISKSRFYIIPRAATLASLRVKKEKDGK